jgi:hypothetical protein
MAHGKFRFHLKAPNGEIIAASQGYETKASAEKDLRQTCWSSDRVYVPTILAC